MTAARIELAAGHAAATIAPDEGGILLSLRVAGHELLVQRRPGTEPVPTFGSFLLAPWVGELHLARLEFRGIRAQLPPNKGRHAVHGLVATGPWQVTDAGRAHAGLARQLEPPWPFGGTVIQDIRLDADGITLEAEIRAGDVAMPAALGWHPWFACQDPGVVRVGVDAASQLELDAELLPTGNVQPVAGDTDLRSTPDLRDRRIDVVYVDALSPARLETPHVDLRIEFEPAIETVVVYTGSPGAVCVEPWSAWPDAIGMAAAGHASGMEVLEPGESLRRWTRWAWSKRMDNGVG